MHSIQVLAGPFEVMTVDFYEDAANKFDGGMNHTFKIDAKVDGEAHAVIAWFDAELTRDGSVTLSTSPWAIDNSFSRQQHWGQIIELLPATRSVVRGRNRGIIPKVKKGAAMELVTTINADGGSRSVYFPEFRVL